MKECNYCGKTFKEIRKTQLYCSNECRLKMAIDKGIENGQYKSLSYKKRLCKTCGKEFSPKYKFHVYCSTICSREKRKNLELHKPIVREYFLERANFICEECKKINNGGMELHHIVPLYKGGEDKSDNIIVLCSECHKNKHNIL